MRIMKHTAISLLILIFLVQLAEAVNISLTAPSSVQVNESFNVTVSALLNNAHDVKIFVKEKEVPERSSTMLSLIFSNKENSWKNPYFYLNASFPRQTAYLLKVFTFKQEVELCAKLRQAENKKVVATHCQSLVILQIPEADNKNERGDEKSDENPGETPSPNISTPLKDSNAREINNSILSDAPAISSSKTIILNQENYYTKENKIRQRLLAVFTLFLIIVLILLVMRKL